MLGTSEGADSSDIKMESDLLREIKDIRDELQIMTLIFKDQQQAIDDMIKETGTSPRIRDLLESITGYLRKVDTMQAQADATYDSVCTSNVSPAFRAVLIC